MPFGDETIYRDPTVPGGTAAWVVYVAIDHGSVPARHKLVVERLNSTWTSGTGRFVKLAPPMVEAPSMFWRAGRWYLTYSDPACPYCVTGTSYAMARGPLGPWSVKGRISSDSCRGQPAAVNTLRSAGGAVRYIGQTDRWRQLPAGFDPNQYLATTYLVPLSFRADGTLPAQPCIRTWTF
jgi:hypothetical protein